MRISKRCFRGERHATAYCVSILTIIAQVISANKITVWMWYGMSKDYLDLNRSSQSFDVAFESELYWFRFHVFLPPKTVLWNRRWMVFCHRFQHLWSKIILRVVLRCCIKLTKEKDYYSVVSTHDLLCHLNHCILQLAALWYVVYALFNKCQKRRYS